VPANGGSDPNARFGLFGAKNRLFLDWQPAGPRFHAPVISLL
jgi:hypothetical protein